MCQLLAPVFQGFFFLLRPLTVLIKQTRQAIHAVRQSILLRCLWFTYVRKMFIKSTTGVNMLKLFYKSLTRRSDKLEYF
jgi:hypothetical protein